MLSHVNKEYILMTNLKHYFLKKENKILFVSIINESHPVSLRIIDWFVTNYSKNNAKKIFTDLKLDIYNNYKSQLKAYNKKLFDPFCRNHKHDCDSKFNFFYDSDNPQKYIVTTIGQLNFFRWAFENNIIPYINLILEDIKNDIKVKGNGIKKNNVKTKRNEKEDQDTQLHEKIYDNSEFSITF